MGLDQYVYTMDPKHGTAKVDFTFHEDPETGECVGREELHYWRKHPNLHGWMEALYRKHGGQDSDFNCSAVRIDSEDLDELERAIESNALPDTRGFFFGQSRPEDIEVDREFVKKARDAIKAGKHVYYTSWW